MAAQLTVAVSASGAAAQTAPDVIWSVQAHASAYEVAISPVGSMIATVGDEELRLWSPTDGTMIRELPTGHAYWPGVDWSPDGALLASHGGFSRSVEIWNPATGEMLMSISTAVGTAGPVAFSPDSPDVVMTGGDIHTWYAAPISRVHLADRAQVYVAYDECSTLATDIKVSPDRSQIAVAAACTSIRSFLDGGLVWSVPEASFAVDFAPGGVLLAAAGNPSAVYRVADGAAVPLLSGAASEAYAIDFTPDGRFLLAGGAGGYFTLWRVADGAVLLDLQDPGKAAVNDLQVTPDGRAFAYCTSDGRLVLARVPSEARCPSDCDKDGDLTVSDFTCMQAAWRAKTAYGDYNGDGKWNINDFIAFQADFRKGCP